MRCSKCKLTLTSPTSYCKECGSPIPLSKRFFLILFRTDELLAGIALAVMVLVVLLQIVLRNFFQTGIGVADPLVRHLVLWIVFLGAGMTAKENSHIRIDFISKLIPPALNRVIETVVSLFSLIILGIMIYAATTFIMMEIEGGMDVPLLSIPVWTTEIIIPAGYFIIAVHTAIHTLKPFFTKEEV